MRNYLKELRVNKNLTQAEIASKLGLSQNYYSMIESGIRQQKMNLPLLQKLSTVFEVSIEYLILKETGESCT